jgi:hypothetical protein
MKRTAILLLLAAGLSAAADAAVIPVNLPILGVVPASLAGAAASLSGAAALTSAASSPSLPVSGPISLPGAAVPLPLPQPVQLALPRAEDYHLDWSHLDGGAAAAAVLPRPRGPKPLPPAGASAQLNFAAAAAKKAGVRIVADALFDAARPHAARVLVPAE